MSTPTVEQIQDLQANVSRLKAELEANHRQVIPLLMLRQNIRISLLDAIEKLSDARTAVTAQAQIEAAIETVEAAVSQ